ncbi:hypothetical protein BJ166DRAFT_21382 [Pestalotiopsis sp. NC0098]|nr:hypothetical protein BJ166DRAFT_21382 [Pestalotiopsis sp. NC0098]
MSDSGAGRIAGKMKWHVYCEPQKPGTLMTLGSILTTPDDLESSLNSAHGLKPFSPDQIYDQTDAVRRVFKSELTSSLEGRIKAVLPVNPFIGAGGGSEGQWAKNNAVTGEALGISARSVLLHAVRDYLESQLTLPSVERYIKEWGFRKSLYVIVGVATCKKLSINETTSTHRGGTIDGDAQIALAGAEAGAVISLSSGRERGSGVEIEQECDFAYRMREFVYSKRKKQLKEASRDVTDGALFKLNDDEALSVRLGHREEVGNTLLHPKDAPDQVYDEEIPVLDYIEDFDEEFGADSTLIA